MADSRVILWVETTAAKMVVEKAAQKVEMKVVSRAVVKVAMMVEMKADM